MRQNILNKMQKSYDKYLLNKEMYTVAYFPSKLVHLGQISYYL